jgi:large subunit ribosomal protein L4
MPEIALYNKEGKEVGTLPLPESVFGVQPSLPLVHQAVVAEEANRRQGTADTKQRGEVRGGGKKPWRQKGTGRARAGSTRSPLWRHGGTIFGPQPRDYSYKMPKKAWRAALCLAISDRAKNGKLFIVESLDLSEPKTKAAKAALVKLGVEHALIVTSEADGKFLLAARNLAAHKVLAIEGLNVYDVLNYRELVMTSSTAKALEARFAGEATARSAGESNE